MVVISAVFGIILSLWVLICLYSTPISVTLKLVAEYYLHVQ